MKEAKTPSKGRVLCINDYEMYSRMVAMLLEREGHYTVQTEILPVDLKAITAFEPDVIILNICRKLETISAGGMHDFYTDVDGAKAFREITRAKASGRLQVPIIVTALAVLERELPKDEPLDYVAFIEVPQKFDQLLMIIGHVLSTKQAKGRLVQE